MRNTYWLCDEKLLCGRMEQFFPFLSERGHIVALVGAGGKTTLLYAFADFLSHRRQRVAVTTTTHILRPDGTVFCRSIQECRQCWSKGRYAVWCREADNGKLTALTKEEFELLCEADTVLVEADGAKQMACKVPAAHEPQIPDKADIVVGVLGLSVLGKPLCDACFRLEEAMELLHCDRTHCLTGEDLVQILTSEQGTRKKVGGRDYYIVLNQCDGREQMAKGREILRLLQEQNQTRAALTCFR